MKVEKTETVIKEVEKVIDRFEECDLCGERIELEDRYDAFASRFEHKTGNNFPEGGYVETLSADFCQTCGEKVINALKDLGVRINKEEWDW